MKEPPFPVILTGMATQRMYYEYSEAGIFRAEIREVRPWPGTGTRAIILDKTIFYPEGGGQKSDRGTINGVPLLDVQEADGDILHLTAGDETGLAPGPADLVLDVHRRRDFTIHHTGQHLLSGTILRMTEKPTVSMRLGEEFCTIDVDTPDLEEETLLAVEEAVMDAIETDCPVIIHYCPPEDITRFPLRKVPPQGEDQIRVVEIQGHDFSPCCGTHCASTGEIGMLRILGTEKYKGMTRLTFIAGRRCLRDSRLLRHNGEICAQALKVPVMETAKGVLALLEKTNRLERELKVREEAAAEFKAQALLEKAGLCSGRDRGDLLLAAEIFPETGIDELLRIGRAAQKKTGALLVLAAEKDLKFAAFCSRKELDIRPLVKEAMEKQGGKGGGGPGFFQGLFETPEALAAFMAAVRVAGGTGEDRP